MYKNNEYAVKLDIQMENGLYVFTDQSAVGKTRLYKELRSHQLDGECVMSYSYTDKLQGINLVDMLNKRKYDVIMLDRYTMYNGDGAEEIVKLRDKSIILIDCKENFNLVDDEEICCIKMTQDKIEVFA